MKCMVQRYRCCAHFQYQGNGCLNVNIKVSGKRLTSDFLSCTHSSVSRIQMRSFKNCSTYIGFPNKDFLKITYRRDKNLPTCLLQRMRGYKINSKVPNLPHSIAHIMTTTLDKILLNLQRRYRSTLNNLLLVQISNNICIISFKADIESK